MENDKVNLMLPRTNWSSYFSACQDEGEERTSERKMCLFPSSFPLPIDLGGYFVKVFWLKQFERRKRKTKLVRRINKQIELRFACHIFFLLVIGLHSYRWHSTAGEDVWRIWHIHCSSPYRRSAPIEHRCTRLERFVCLSHFKDLSDSLSLRTGFWTWKSILFLGLMTLCVIAIVLAFLFIIFRKKFRRTKQTPAKSEPAKDTSSDQKHPLVSDVWGHFLCFSSRTVHFLFSINIFNLENERSSPFSSSL